MRGTITMYRPEKLYGFIEPDDGAAHVFFHWRSLIEDTLGRRRAEVGFQVEFGIEFEDARAHTRASYVRVLWDDAEDLESYREESVITRWFHATGSGIARRPDGGTVAVSVADVVTIGEETLGVGSRILHGIQPPALPETEVWPPPNTKPFDRDVIGFPASSPLLSERLKNKRLRNIRIRRAS